MSFCTINESINYLAIRINMTLHNNVRNLLINTQNNKYLNLQISFYYMNKKYICQLNIKNLLSKEQIEDCINKLIIKIESRF